MSIISTVSRLALFIAAFLTCTGARAKDTAGDELGRTAFIAAMQRLTDHQADLPDPAALKRYPIYDYLLAARLRRDLAQAADEALDARIDGFAQAHAGEPVVRTLRHDWLQSLAQRGRWDWYLPRSVDVSDPALLCQRFVGRIATGDLDGLAAGVLVRYEQAQRLPAQCNGPIGWLRQQSLLTPAIAISRARAALAAGDARLAREAAADVPAPYATDLLRWSDLLEAPKSALNVLATHPDLAIDNDAMVAGFDKLSRADPNAAIDLLPLLLKRPDVDADVRARLQRSAALGAAYGRDARALALFSDLNDDPGDTQVQEWRVRAALWQGNYSQALIWIDRMAPALQSQPRWRYWRARATQLLSGDAAAAPLYAEVAGTRDYYGYLAADRIHVAYRLNVHESLRDLPVQNAIASEPGMIRAHALFDCDLADDALAEWNAVLAGATPTLKIQAAQLASRWGWYAQAIATLAQTGEFDDVLLRYPRPFADAVMNAAKFADLPPEWIWGVMRQESLYRKDAVSRADARGLMQMLPGTAKLLARRWHLATPSRDELFDPTVAIPLGAAYLHELLARYGGSLILGLAAYNAGPNAVARWLPPQTTDPEIWVENIPYNETRGYVQHILEHIVAFATVGGAAPPRLATMLKPVDSTPQASEDPIAAIAPATMR